MAAGLAAVPYRADHASIVAEVTQDTPLAVAMGAGLTILIVLMRLGRAGLP